MIALFGWVGFSFTAFIMGISKKGRTCRGEFLDGKSRGQLEEYSWWSLEPLKYEQYGEVVQGYDKTRGTFLFWVGFTLWIHVFTFLVFVCSYTTKVEYLSDLVNAKPKKLAAK